MNPIKGVYSNVKTAKKHEICVFLQHSNEKQ